MEANLKDLKIQRTFSIRHSVHERTKKFKGKYGVDISEIFEKGAIMFMDQYEKEHK